MKPDQSKIAIVRKRSQIIKRGLQKYDQSKEKENRDSASAIISIASASAALSDSEAGKLLTLMSQMLNEES